MDPRQLAELEAIEAIYCKPEEFSRMAAPEGQYVTIKLDLEQPDKMNCVHRCGLHVLIPADYPLDCLNIVEVLCEGGNIPVQTLHSFKLEVIQQAEVLQGEPILLDLLCFTKELFEKYIEMKENDIKKPEDSFVQSVSDLCLKSNPDEDINSYLTCNCTQHRQSAYHKQAKLFNEVVSSDSERPSVQNHKKRNKEKRRDWWRERNVRRKERIREVDVDLSASDTEDEDGNSKKDPPTTALLLLDHMRDRPYYTKQIREWTSKLGLSGRLLFYGKFIFILLQGGSLFIQEYITRNRTRVVDFDSKGRRCKERLLSVLCEKEIEKYKILTEFIKVEDIESLNELSAMFQSFNMDDIFNEYIEPICCGKKSVTSPQKVTQPVEPLKKDQAGSSRRTKKKHMKKVLSAAT